MKYFQEPKSSALSNGGPGGAGKDGAELRGGFVLKSRSDEAPVRRRSLVERTGMKNLIQVGGGGGGEGGSSCRLFIIPVPPRSARVGAQAVTFLSNFVPIVH